MQVIDYDNLTDWGPVVRAAVLEVIPIRTLQQLRTFHAASIEDALKLVLTGVCRHGIVEHVSKRLSSYQVRVYHGTRLSDAELALIRAEGLRPLRLSERRGLLAGLFRHHERWEECQHRLDEVLHDLGPGDGAGRREDDCVHVCFSRAGLVYGCSHYLIHGAEVDGHVAYRLFGNDTADSLLQRGRSAKLITFLAPFSEAAGAANPYGFPADEMPSLIGILLNAWAYSETNSAFKVTDLNDCTAARFKGQINPQRLKKIIDVPDTELGISLN